MVQKSSNPIWSHVLSQSPVDTELVNLLLEKSNPTITSFDLLRIGSVQLTVRTVAQFRALVIGTDGRLLGKTKDGFPTNFVVGQPFDPAQIEGLEAPYQAALAGETELSRLYTLYKPEERFITAMPVIDNLDGDNAQVLGVVVLIVDALPTQADVPAQLLNLSGSSLLIFLLGIGILGAIFGAFFAHGLTSRFKRLSTAIDLWSEGDFSEFIVDTAGDEISGLAQRLNNMAKQLQELLHRRQDMAVSEERNRLARDLHDSAKQQALAASFQLGTALTLFDRDPQTAKKHLVEADSLVDSVRNELTNLVHELRPLTTNEQDFSEILKEYILDWSQRSGIESNISIEEDAEAPLKTRETLFRIAQEALANVTRHSSASSIEMHLEYEGKTVTMTIKDNGRGFDVSAKHTGLGLSSMRERAEVLGGSFSVVSAPDQGTQIIVTIPKTL
jgi:NarL family two-component system sensor histidine kinase LiaS